MWMDSDVFCTRVWEQDPIAAMQRYDLALLFDHFPQGAAMGWEFPQRAKEAFNRTVCDISMVDGRLVARDGRCYHRPSSRIKQVHGFFHPHLRRPDPAAVLAGNRSYDMRTIGVKTRVFHNYVIDGRMQDWRGYFVNWWNRNANTSFPEALECPVTLSG
eukprot:jgi/Psemu1/325289/estExt_fgenesh1_pg.C_2220007